MSNAGNTQAKKRISGARLIITIVIFVLAAALIAASITGFIMRGSASSATNLNNMRTSAVLHAASGGLVDSIASAASAAKLKELRARADFRSLGSNVIESECKAAADAARAEAEAKYGNTAGIDTAAFLPQIDAMEAALAQYNELRDDCRGAYADIYTELVKSSTDWSDFTAGKDEATIAQALTTLAPALSEEENAYLLPGFVRMAQDLSAAEEEADRAALYAQLTTALTGAIPDWSVYAEVTDDEALWANLTQEVPELANGEDFKAELIAEARIRIASAQEGTDAEAQTETAVEEVVTEEAAETVVDYGYFTESEPLATLNAASGDAFAALWAQLVKIIPDLETLDNKMLTSVQDKLSNIVYSGTQDFSTRYNIYAAEKADQVLAGNDAFTMQLAASAGVLLIFGIALLLLGLAYVFWKPLIRKLGVPRTIISLFFIFLCLAAEFYNINVPLMLGNVLERVGMYGVLVLAMLPGIQCGIGLNMGMTIGCISGLLSVVIALQYNLTGAPALVFSCVVGMIIAMPLGWAYSKLLNRMKGNEMTISTYVGFSFVSLMCIGWMLLPFNNTKIIWLLSGRGLRVTHSLLGSFAHLLDRLLAFDLFGAEIPTGLIAFFLLCCLAMWLFSRSKTGIAMAAAGSNPRFAEASGINVDHMRTIGTTLSTMIAAVGIVIYSQAFGYAQLYTAPRQLGFIAASAILIGGATVSKAKVSHVIVGVFLFEGVLALGQQIANSVVAGGGLSEVMRIMISNGIILYALTQSGGARNE